MTMTRREFLIAANAAALLVFLESCSLGGSTRKAVVPTASAGGTKYEQSMKLMLEAVRSSPDHLALRAEDVVASKDAAAIVEFVRGRIAVVPPFTADDARSARRWGPAAMLRGGQGTLRERADLLADLLTRAGFKATVQEADRPSSVTLDNLYGSRSVAFAPDESGVKRALAILGSAGLPSPSPLEASRPSTDPAAQILAALPASVQNARVRGDLLPPKIPIVTFDDHGKTRYAFALDGLGVMDAPPSGLRSTIGADVLKSLSITVSAVASPAIGSSTASGRLVDLVTAHWTLDQVVGRQVLLTFPPIQGSKALLQSSLAALPVRVPTLRVQAPGPHPAQGLAAGGPPITVQGDVLQAGASAGAVAGPYGPITTLSDADRHRAIASVAAIDASANAAAFPEVALEVSARDASGAAVTGLDAPSFTIAEDGKPVDGFQLLSNGPPQPRPRVLLVYDGGFADMWPSAAVKTAFDSGLVNALADLAAKRPFDLQVVGLGVQPLPSSWSPQPAAAISAAIAAAAESADDPWSALGGAALDQGVSAIVIVSDFDSVDADPRRVPTFQRRLVTSKVPVFAVPVGRVDQAALSQVVSLSRGAQFAAGDPAAPSQIAARLAPLLSGWVGGGYRIRYRAQAGATQRAVTVGLAGGTKTATAAYTVPSSPVPPPSFSGLYVRIEIGGVITAFRRIAGVMAMENGTVLGTLDDPDAIAQVRGAIDGITTIAIEPGATTAAALIDDAFVAQMSIEPARRLKSASADDLLNALSGGIKRLPLGLVGMLQPPPTQPGAVRSLRVAILQERSLDGKTVETHADFAVGANPVIPIQADAHAAFRAVLAASTAESTAELALYDDSALARLDGKALIPIVSGDYAALRSFLSGVPSNRHDAWDSITRLYGDYHLVVPSGGAADALWVIDPATGAAKAALLDSTGGARFRCEGDTGELAMATMLALASIACNFLDKIYPFQCIGINVSASGMCVVQLFDGSADFTTIPSIWLTWKPLTGYPPGNAAVGFMLLYLSLAAANCI